MAPPRRRFAAPPSSPRYLTLRHGRAIIQAYEERDGLRHYAGGDRRTEKLDEGCVKLRSAEVPGLAFGSYTIQTKQRIRVKNGDDSRKADPSGTQDFEVKGPRFVLPEDAIYSCYPPPGHTETLDVLPHVVFNDPELPWERVGSWDSEPSAGTPLGKEDWDRNRTPWLAVLTFTREELSLSPDGLTAVLANTSLKGSTVAQTETFGVDLPTEDLKKMENDFLRIPYKDDIDSVAEAKTTMIFVKPTLFNCLFANYDDKGSISPRIGQKDKTPAPTVWQYRFLAHVRSMNPSGMAHASAEDVVVNRDFSIVVGSRTGPLLPLPATQPNKPPATQIVSVHVVSIEGVEKMRPFPLDTATLKRVGLVSLFSWTFECLPPESRTIADQLSDLGLSGAPLCAKIPTFPATPTPVEVRIQRRLEDGYALLKYRVQTGEDTVGLYRGPLVPKAVPKRNWELLSNSGTNLQILDKELGIMDISYSTAWQLGRTMALANRAYTTALTRVRRAILNLASDSAQLKSLDLANIGITGDSRESLALSLGKVLRQLRDLSSTPKKEEVNLNRHWFQQPGEIPSLSYDSPAVAYHVEDALHTAAKLVASTTDGSTEDEPRDVVRPYNEFNTPYSADWVLVLRFVLDLYHLVEIPLHYLLPDMAQLPVETMRYFVIDVNWVDALIDGALCLGNQGTLSLKGVDEQPQDLVRSSIKAAICDYFEFVIKKLNYKPPVPKFGIFIRSQIMAKFPDLRIDARPLQDKNGAPLLLRHDIINKDLVAMFFGDVTTLSKGKLEALTLTLPPHQQSYSAARRVTSSEVEISYKKIYTQPGHDDDNDRRIPIEPKLSWEKSKPRADGRSPVFLWDSQAGANDARILLVENFAKDFYKSLQAKLNLDPQNPGFDEICPTAAMMAFQLNVAAWQLYVNTTDISPSNHLLTYPRCVLNLAAPQVPCWPAKRQHAAFSNFEESKHAPGLRLTMRPAYHQRLLPIELIMEDFHNPDLHRRTKEADDEESSQSWSLVAPHSPRLSITSLSSCSELEPPRMMTGTPVFECTTRPAANPASLDIPVTSRKQDLVFSIIYQGKGDEFLLSSIVITIRMLNLNGFTNSTAASKNPQPGRSSPPTHASSSVDLDANPPPPNDPSPTPSADSDNWLFKTYEENRAFMVSNIRFNVRVTYSVKDSALKLLLVPRTMSGWVRAKEFKAGVTDMSVCLVGCRVRQVAKDKDVVVAVRPVYTNSLSDDIPCVVRLRPGASLEG